MGHMGDLQQRSVEAGADMRNIEAGNVQAEALRMLIRRNAGEKPEVELLQMLTDNVRHFGGVLVDKRSGHDLVLPF